jgi:hypothetical protein
MDERSTKVAKIVVLVAILGLGTKRCEGGGSAG